MAEVLASIGLGVQRLSRPRAGLAGRAAGAAVLGGVSVLSFAPFHGYPLAVLCLAGLFALTQGMRAWPAMLIGLAYGVGTFGYGTRWLLVALHDVGGAPLALAVGLLVALVLLMAAYAALLMGIAARWAPRPDARRLLLVLPAGWVVFEWLRGWLFSGFTWLDLGYGQIDGPLAGYAPVFGVYGMSAAVALSAGGLVYAMQQRARYRASATALAAVAALWGVGAALGTIHWTTPAGQTIDVALVQGAVAQQAKSAPEAAQRGLAHYLDLSRGHTGVDVIVWPETAIAGLYRRVAPTLQTLGDRLQRRGVTLLTGVLRASRTARAAGGVYPVYNSVIALGASHGVYHKRHLVPFGEYFPVPAFVKRWLRAHGLPSSNLDSGPAGQPPLTIRGRPVGVSICYEDAFARDIRPEHDAAWLVNVSDDAWFGRSIGPDQHFQMARVRAAETGRYMVRADNSSVTAIVGPKGQVQSRLPGFQPGVLEGRIEAYRGETPFDAWGYVVVIAGALGIFLAALAWPVVRVRR